jgi:hypothetical protein
LFLKRYDENIKGGSGIARIEIMQRCVRGSVALFRSKADVRIKRIIGLIPCNFVI